MQSTRSWRSRMRALGALGALIALVLGAPASAEAHGGRRGAPPLTFGVYAGSAAGMPGGGLATGPADEPQRIQSALDRLQGGFGRPFLVRGFTAFVDQPAGTISNTLPQNIAQYAVHGRKVDLVLGYASTVNSLDGWTRYVRDMVHAYGRRLGSIQIAEEPNLLIPGGPDATERSRRAVVEGVIAADEQLRRDGLRRSVEVGTNVFASGDPDTAFWQGIGRLGSPRFRAALDYLGVDMYPDVFAPGDVSDSIKTTLRVLREQSMPLAGLGHSVPIHVSEHGWPTGQGRTDAKQLAALEEGIRTVSDIRGEFNVTHYELFDLRDADSTVGNYWYQFGLLRSDYSPKPAFETVRRLMRELGSR